MFGSRHLCSLSYLVGLALIGTQIILYFDVSKIMYKSCSIYITLMSMLSFMINNSHRMCGFELGYGKLLLINLMEK